MISERISLEWDLRAHLRHQKSVPIAVCVLAGLAMGVVAKLLGEEGNRALLSLAAGTAIWLGIGFILVSELNRRWEVTHRLLWSWVLVAAYLYAWLLTYHLTDLLVSGASGWTVWSESRIWVACVAPACVVLGSLATRSLNTGALSEACLAVPLAWSLPEVVTAIHHGWSYALIAGVPILAVACVPLYRERSRLRRPSVIVVTAMLGGALLIPILPSITRYISGM